MNRFFGKDNSVYPSAPPEPYSGNVEYKPNAVPYEAEVSQTQIQPSRNNELNNG